MELLADLWDSAQKLCLELGQVTGGQTLLQVLTQYTSARPQLWMQQQQDTPNAADIDYSNDFLCVCLQTAHESLNVLLKTTARPVNR